MRPHEETQPPDPLGWFRTFVVVVAGSMPLALVAAAIWQAVTGPNGGGSTGGMGWLVAYPLFALGSLWLYSALFRSPAGSAAVGFLLLLLPVGLLVAVPLTHLEMSGAVVGYAIYSGIWYPAVTLVGTALEITSLYAGWEDRWRAGGWQDPLLLEESQEVGRSVDR